MELEEIEGEKDDEFGNEGPAQTQTQRLPDHLQVGLPFFFRVSVLQISDLPFDYSEIFCQFKFARVSIRDVVVLTGESSRFLRGNERGFKTTIEKIEQRNVLRFLHAQNVRCSSDEETETVFDFFCLLCRSKLT